MIYTILIISTFLELLLLLSHVIRYKNKKKNFPHFLQKRI
ncbi:hypothetical protein M107_4090 [Bacteroides fragilis str. 3725 D9(v)]|nr:hypothetical protein M107_4090 [Bacteroides fragilis str. 3725 D9(v)]